MTKIMAVAFALSLICVCGPALAQKSDSKVNVRADLDYGT